MLNCSCQVPGSACSVLNFSHTLTEIGTCYYLQPKNGKSSLAFVRVFVYTFYSKYLHIPKHKSRFVLASKCNDLGVLSRCCCCTVGLYRLLLFGIFKVAATVMQ